MHRLIAALFLVRSGLNFAVLYILVELLIQLRSAGPFENLLGIAIVGVLGAISLWIPVLVASVVASAMMMLGRPWHHLGMRVFFVCGFIEVWALWTGAPLWLLGMIALDIAAFALLVRVRPERARPSALVASASTSH